MRQNPQTFQLTRLISGGIITNYDCPSRCRHCLYNCGPARSRDYIEEETVRRVARIIRSMGGVSVHIGGGEPFLHPEKLAAVLPVIVAEGVEIDYVETNAFWFENHKTAVRLLGELRDRGLSRLLVSISPFHNEFIPYEKVRGVIQAAKAVGVGVFPWMDIFSHEITEFATDRPHSLDEYRDRFGPDYLLRVLDRYWVHMGGRAVETYRPVLKNTPVSELLVANPSGCATELTNTTHFHMDLYGNYIPGLCAGLAISLKDLAAPLAAEHYPVLTTLFFKGIRGLFALAEQTFDYTSKRNAYLNKCDLCREIRKFFVRRGFGGARELAPIEFYDLKPADPKSEFHNRIA